MFPKRYIGYALFAVLVICWLLEIESRNQQFPKIRDVNVEEVEGQSHINFQINNPKSKPVRVATHIRLHSAGHAGAKHEFSASPVTVLTLELEPRSALSVEQLVSNVGNWQQADVQLYVLDDAIILRTADLDRLGRISLDRLQELFK